MTSSHFDKCNANMKHFVFLKMKIVIQKQQKPKNN